MNLAIALRDLKNAEDNLAKCKKESIGKKKEIALRWKSLVNEEKSLRLGLIKFNKVTK